MKYLSAGLTQKGKRKSVNQDSVLILPGYFADQNCVLAVICDGMGGLEKGEFASKEVVRQFAEWFWEKKYAKGSDDELADLIYASWEKLLQKIHFDLREYGRKMQTRVGTTVTAMIFLEREYHIVHVGDSRAYEITDKAHQLTIDQTLSCFAEKNISGIQTGRLKKMSSVLIQGIGASERIRPVYISGEVKENAVYLLCSDGFRHKIDSNELIRWFKPEDISNEKMIRQRLNGAVKEVVERGERDDVSALIICAAEQDGGCKCLEYWSPLIK